MRPIRLVEFAGKSPFSVVVVPALADNYSYLVADGSTGQAMAVDPVDPHKIAGAIRANWNLSCIATTHHHEDHAGGNVTLSKMSPKTRIYGFDDRIPAMTHKLADGESFHLGHLRVEAIHCPCHTSGSLSYVIHDDLEDPSERAVFTGDTLFLGGCGRFFEGSANDMYLALYQKIGKLARSTKVFVGHEYTLKNLEFALRVEPSNLKLKARLNALKQALLADQSLLTVPGSLEEEWDTNPFMRLNAEEVMSTTGTKHPVETMAALREMKNNFK